MDENAEVDLVRDVLFAGLLNRVIGAPVVDVAGEGATAAMGEREFLLRHAVVANQDPAVS